FQDVRDCKDTEELEDLNSKARNILNQLKTKIQDLERLGKEQDRDEDRQVILKNVENHRQRMTSNIASLRKTNLTVKMSIDKQEKDELLTGGTARKRNINTKENLAKTATNITESLMELNQTMDAQVKKGNLTLTALEASSKNLTDTHEEFKTMGGHIQNSKRLLTKYGQRELTDKLLIFIALVFFFATVIYILKRRLWS
ncbi:vesicle transport protein SEC20-like, partial [Mercenaria mercenaria]|uniref:vesicle transport protein SEC20-like n=1 Tax=Mercenaria mercenaria TaxID=6596 RepID=UPI00234FAF50